MELRRLSVERYKGYRELTQLDIAPLTILLGPNNSGKSALVRAIQLLAGGLIPENRNSTEPLPLASGGIRHGETFGDLVTGCAVHGKLTLSAVLRTDSSELSMSATVRNVIAPPRPSERQIEHWHLCSGMDSVVLDREDFSERSLYRVSVSGAKPNFLQVDWEHLIPSKPNGFDKWLGPRIASITSWARGVRHLQCPRFIRQGPLIRNGQPPKNLGPDGRNTPLILLNDPELLNSVNEWYRRVFGVNLRFVAQGTYAEFVVETTFGNTKVQFEQAGRSLAYALPIVVLALSADRSGPGVDVIEHPEAMLHPTAQADIAELLLDNLAGAVRPMIIETHSELLLLRVRRWIAEGKMPADHVHIYWVSMEPERGSFLRKIRINRRGEIQNWPIGVFTEDYEEVLAIRRAARQEPRL